MLWGYKLRRLSVVVVVGGGGGGGGGLTLGEVVGGEVNCLTLGEVV